MEETTEPNEEVVIENQSGEGTPPAEPIVEETPPVEPIVEETPPAVEETPPAVIEETPPVVEETPPVVTPETPPVLAEISDDVILSKLSETLGRKIES